MKFVPASFEVPLLAVQRICAEIVKPFDRVDLGNGAIHVRLDSYGIRASALFPLFVKTVLI